jgi:1-acyl-sn-glycerol-3-phosphate acyltransferase
MSQLSLLRTRRFGAFFWTQFFGAFNDNLFRNALATMVAYQSLSVWGIASEQLVALAGAIFILPFFLFSASAGQLADKYPKHRLVRWVKLGEVGVMALAIVGFATGSLGLLLCVLFLMGLQSAFFGPVKFSILPQLLADDDLVGGNALVETGTFLSILLGMIAGAQLVGIGQASVGWVGLGVLGVAVGGFVSSLFIPKLRPENPALRVTPNPVAPTIETYRFTRKNRAVFLSVLGIAWFWFLGIALLALLPNYSKDVLHGSKNVMILFQGVFCVGVAGGSLLCERLSERKVELGLVPFGSIGMTLFTLDLFWVGQPQPTWPDPTQLMGVPDFLASPHALRILLDLFLLSAFSGFYVVPLQAMIQQRSEPSYRSRVIAGNNILGALFMVVSSLLITVLLAIDLSLPQIFLVLAILNAGVAFYIYKVIPEFLFRFVAWLLANIMYRLKTVDRGKIPFEGPALLVCNHVSFIDWLIIASACKRPVRFVMYHGFTKVPLLRFLFRDAKVIPIAPAREDAQILEAAYDRIAQELESGEVVCIFPEGKLTSDGKMQPFRPGLANIVRHTPVPVIPMALKGLWGSFFSRKGGAALRRPFRRFWSRVELVVGDPVAPEEVSAEALATRVAALAELEPPRPPSARTAPAT